MSSLHSFFIIAVFVVSPLLGPARLFGQSTVAMQLCNDLVDLDPQGQGPRNVVCWGFVGDEKLHMLYGDYNKKP